ncbi:DUF6531 domain-containing protein [Pseudomonas sp. Irchel 3A5]|uniref:DUF6531 domain-containing protein n=1 Tax=Pseudomonas sp. Irchel 3A5 TaxID=2008911 RepID=UPI00113FC48B|nr:DUF6531 domain-containing protein [Pseudomonas sp. Irchel 3A5]
MDRSSFKISLNVIRFLILICYGFSMSSARGEVLWDALGTGDHWVHIDNFDTREQAFAQCAIFDSTYRPLGQLYGGCSEMGVWGSSATMAFAGWYQVPSNGKFHVANYYINKCESKSRYNVSTAECGNDEQKGAPPPESCIGNPINFAIGNKFQSEVDYRSLAPSGLGFSRSYNSLDGIWRHSYSTYLRFAIGKLSLVHADGRESFFTVAGDTATAYPTELGRLSKTAQGWLYEAVNNEQFSFDSTGKLTSWTDAQGGHQRLAYAGGLVTVTSSTGQTLSFTEDDQHQPLTLIAPGLRVSYTYDTNKHLVSLTHTRGSQVDRRLFHYEDTRNPALLTGITDERGVRFATWAYDAQSRAISSQHSGGAGLTQITYNADGSSTVTNELGKQTVYRYLQIFGVKRITSIEGEPSPNCPASNSSYTYNDRGQVLTKTDAKGLVTAHTYNDRGLETSRTEASGTHIARTIITEWDATRFLPVRIQLPSQTIVYSYDNMGRKLSRQVQSNQE